MKILIAIPLFLCLNKELQAQNTYPWPPSGNVGVNVGASAVLNKFQVGSNFPGWSLNDVVISNTQGALAIHNDVGQTYIYGTQAITIRPGYGQMAIYAHPTGKVGIQSTNPQGTLQIGDYRPVIIKSNGGNGVYGSEIGFNAVLDTSTPANKFRKLGGSSQNGGASIAVDYSGNMLFQMYNANTESESIVSYNPQIAFFSNGSVGIGTTAPGSFKLAVNGKIWTQEVNVAMINPGPDYVFEKDYNLLPLSELETYISQNKHLPEVPSAKEMEAEGLNLKEMNLLLLKKVEELTLHLIEIKKENLSQQEQINTLRNECKK